MNCLNCGEEIPIHHEQVGGVHMSCEWYYFKEKSQLMFKFRPLDCTPWVVVDKETLESEMLGIAHGDLESHEESVI